MGIRNHDWYNRNTLRAFPCDTTATLRGDDTTQLPGDLFCDLQLQFSSIAGLRAYIGAVTVTDKLVTVIFMAATSVTTATTTVLGAVQLPQPVEAYRHYAISPTYPGTGGWVVFGPGVSNNYRGRFSTPPQTLLAMPAARSYAQLSIPHVGKTGNAEELTGLVQLIGGNDVEIVGAHRTIPSFPVPACSRYRDPTDVTARKVIVFRLGTDNPGTEKDHPLAKYIGPCGGRPESLTCPDNAVIHSINRVTPDCCGNIYLEFRGDAVATHVTQEAGVAASGVLLDSGLDMADARAHAKRLPAMDGTLPSDYTIIDDGDTTPVSVESCWHKNTPEQNLIWVSDAFTQSGSDVALSGTKTDGLGHPYNGVLGDKFTWAADAAYYRDGDDYARRTGATQQLDDWAVIAESLSKSEYGLSCEFQSSGDESEVHLQLSSSTTDIGTDTRVLGLIHVDGTASFLQIRGETAAIPLRTLATSATFTLAADTTYRFTFRATATGFVAAITVNGTQTTCTAAVPADLSAAWDQLDYAGFVLGNDSLQLKTFMVCDPAAVPGLVGNYSDDPGLPHSDSFTSTGGWTIYRGDFTWDTSAGTLTSDSTADLNLAIYDNSGAATLGRKATAVFTMPIEETWDSYYGGVVANYRETAAGSKKYQYWMAGVDWGGEASIAKTFRLSYYDGCRWITVRSVTVPNMDLVQYTVTLEVQPGAAGSAWLTASVSDGSAIDITIGPAHVNNYTPDSGKFGVMAYRSTIQFETFTVDNL